MGLRLNKDEFLKKEKVPDKPETMSRNSGD